MMSFVEYDAGAAVPVHRHRREQITYVLDGFLEVTIDTERRVLGPGEGVRIPRQTDHSSRPVGGPARALDAWTPVPERLKVEEPSTLGAHVPVRGESPL
jgi:quercetin dioxygenase-like cupin family protein